MPENLFKTQLIILGLIDHIFDSLKVMDNRKGMRDNLLAAIQASCTSEMLEVKKTADAFSSALASIPTNANLDVALESMQKALQANQPSIDLLPVLKKAAKITLRDFVVKTNKPELGEIIDGVLA